MGDGWHIVQTSAFDDKISNGVQVVLTKIVLVDERLSGSVRIVCFVVGQFQRRLSLFNINAEDVVVFLHTIKLLFFYEYFS